MTNTINGASELDTGHSTSILNALCNNERKSVFTGPIKSARNPHQRRPTAEEKLKPATKPAPAEGESPSELLYSGRKKGGTKSGKVPIEPARKRVMNWMFLKRRLMQH
jgi:hypothetical protein